MGRQAEDGKAARGCADGSARHVHKLSTMERAIGGPHLFPSQSPSFILANALRRQRGRGRRQGLGEAGAGHASWEALQANPAELSEEAGAAPLPPQQQPLQQPAAAAAAPAAPPPPPSQQQRGQLQTQQREQQPVAAVAAAPYYRSFELQGEAIARRIGFDRMAAAAAAGPAAPAAVAVPVAPAAPAAVPVAPAAAAGGDGGGDGREGDGDSGVASGGIMGLTVEAAQRLPPTVLSSSCTDLTVPWYESAEMFWMLRDCGVPAKHLVYNKVSHGDFVTGWAALPRVSGQVAVGEADLPPHAADLVKLVSGRVAVRYTPPHP